VLGGCAAVEEAAEDGRPRGRRFPSRRAAPMRRQEQTDVDVLRRAGAARRRLPQLLQPQAIRARRRSTAGRPGAAADADRARR
jgi:hypothetical protein